jgi:hypothetical protein
MILNLSVSGSQRIYPKGFRIPDYNDWCVLVSFLNSGSIAGVLLKVSELHPWLSPDTARTIDTEFQTFSISSQAPIITLYHNL